MINSHDRSPRSFLLPWRNNLKSNIVLRCSWLMCGLILAVVITLSVSANSAFAAKRASNHSVYVFKQTSKVFGDQTVYVSPTALRLDMKRVNCTVVTKLPGQKFQMYSPSKKLVYETEISKWHSNFTAPDKFEKSCREAGVTWRSVGTKSICGIKCGEYILGKLRGSKDDFNRSLPKDPDRRRYFMADSIAISHEATELFARMCRITPINKMPLRVRRWDKKQDDFYDQLNTTACEKKTVPASFFSVPPGYKKTEREFDIFVAFGDSADPTTGIEDILFRSTPGKGEPKQ